MKKDGLSLEDEQIIAQVERDMDAQLSKMTVSFFFVTFLPIP